MFDEFFEVVDETIELYHKDGKELPVATAEKDLGGFLWDVA